MKSALISIQPKWCELIANGKKTIEVRKTRPKIDVPFKCYIYCTQGKDVLAISQYADKSAFLWKKSDVDRYNADMVRNGKVIGEFVCDDIDAVMVYNNLLYCERNSQPNKLKQMCLSPEEVGAYLGERKCGYNWHISDLVIYDKPKELSEFFHYCGDNPKCDGCEAHYYNSNECGTEDYCCSVVAGCKPLKRPPQSWCYVTEQ